KVRVHADGEAATAARAVHAYAYTIGRDVVFGARQYAPGTTAGRALIAHELAHVVQQDFGNAWSSGPIEVGPAGHRHEQEADRTAASVNDSGAAKIDKPGRVPIRVQRACGPAQIGKRTECAAMQGDISGEHYLFAVNCDTFRPGEEDRLRAFANLLTSG